MITKLKNSHFSKFASSSVGIILAAVFGLALFKFISIKEGPKALGEFGLFRQFFQVVAVILSFGNGFSLIEGVAKNKHDESSLAKYLGKILNYYFLGFITLTLAVIIFSNQISQFIFSGSLSSQIFYKCAPLFLSASIFFFYRFSLAGQKNVFSSSIAQSFPLLFLLILYFFNFSLIWLFTLAYLLAAVLTMIIGRKSVGPKIVKPTRDNAFERTSLSTFITGIAGFGALLIVKAIASHFISIESVGMFEASFNLTSYTSLIFLNGLSLYYLPQVTSNKDNQDFIQKTFLLILALASLSFIFFIITKAQLIPLFFSKDFTESVDLLAWFALGEFFRAFNWFYIFTFIAHSYKKRYVVADVISNIFFCVISYSLLRQSADIQLIGKSYVIVQVLFLLLNITLCPKKIRFSRKFHFIPLITGVLFSLLLIDLF